MLLSSKALIAFKRKDPLIHSAKKILTSKENLNNKTFFGNSASNVITIKRTLIIQNIPNNRRSVFNKIKNIFKNGDNSLANAKDNPIKKLNIPRTPKNPQTFEYHGRQYVDEFYDIKTTLMEGKVHPLIIEEDNYTTAIFKALERQIKYFMKEFKHIIMKQPKGLPEKVGDYYYSTREGKYYYIYYRTHGLDGKEEIILDGDKEVANHEFFQMNHLKISKDQKLFGFIRDTTGKEIYSLDIRDIASGKKLCDTIDNVVNFEWSQDSKSVYYTVADSKHRPYRLMKRTFGEKEDVLIKEEKDERYFIDICRTKDWKYILLNSFSKTTSESSLLLEDGSLLLISARERNSQFFIDHSGDYFYIITDEGGEPNFKILRSTFENIGDRMKWEEFLPSSENIKIDEVDLFENHLLLYERHEGVSKLHVFDLRTNESHYIDLPYPIGSIEPGVNLDYHSNTARFYLSTPVIPQIAFDYNMDTRELTKLGEIDFGPELKAKIDINNFEVSRVHVNNNGVNVPMTIIHSKSIKKDGNNPTLVNVYGAYGTNFETGFHLDFFNYIVKGWVVAIAHVRGGGEMGNQWHIDGKIRNKKNSFDDFIACSQYLIDQNYTRSELMAAKSTSAGGLILGYVANNYPDLYKALILRVPFVDALTAMLDETLPLTIHEYDEWGNPNDVDDFDNIKSYDPYSNIESHPYPAMYITGSTMDIRCPLWQQLRYVAKLRANKTDDNLLMLKIDQYGHFGQGDEESKINDFSKEMAFLYYSLNLIKRK